MKITLVGRPITKKNSLRSFRGRVLPSAAYERYERGCLLQIRRPEKPIDYPVTVKVLYYMPIRGKVDLLNLLSASCDILVKAGVLADDHSGIAASHDGSRVLYDKENPRAEITITPLDE